MAGSEQFNSRWERLRRRAQRLYRRHAVFRITREECVPRYEPRIAVAFETATPERLSDLLAFRSDKLVASFERYLQAGQLGIIGYHNGEAIAHGWVVLNVSNVPFRANRYFRLRRGEALIHHCSVAERYRGKGIFQALLCELYRYSFNEKPIETIYIDTEMTNIASQKAIQNTSSFLRREYYVCVFSHMFRMPWSGLD